jgi:hypothetical protein
MKNCCALLFGFNVQITVFGLQATFYTVLRIKSTHFLKLFYLNIFQNRALRRRCGGCGIAISTAPPLQLTGALM